MNGNLKTFSSDFNSWIFSCLKIKDKIYFEDYVLFMNNLLYGGIKEKCKLLFGMIDND